MRLEKLISPFIYLPWKAHYDKPGQYGLEYESVTIQTDDGVLLHGWQCLAESPIASLLFCHGNAGNISHRLPNVARLAQAGFNVLIFDYRGYGKSRGRPSEAGLRRDALAAWDVLLARSAKALPGLIFGRSLGGAVAIALAAEVQGPNLSGLIVESSFTSLGAMARNVYKFPLLEKLAGYPSIERISQIQTPLLIIHGEADKLIPFTFGRRLYEAANQPKYFYAIPGAGHNDTWLLGGDAYFQRLAAFANAA